MAIAITSSGSSSAVKRLITSRAREAGKPTVRPVYALAAALCERMGLAQRRRNPGLAQLVVAGAVLAVLLRRG